MTESFDGEARTTAIETAPFIDWCRNQIGLLQVGGVWGIPRSGLVFTKKDETTLVLTERMPHEPGMPLTAEELHAYQDEEIAETQKQFAAAGITVIVP